MCCFVLLGNVSVSGGITSASATLGNTLATLPYAVAKAPAWLSSTTRNAWIDAGLSITVPSTGQYLVVFTARLLVVTTPSDWWNARVYDSTTNSAVATTWGYAFPAAYIEITTTGTTIAALTAGDVLRL